MSRLIQIEVKNFMSIAHAVIPIGEDNIINLCGYNNSGKTATTTAVEIAFYNTYQQEHVNYIKDGETYWAIGLKFDDGIEINRYKRDDGKSIFEMYKDDKLLYTNERGKEILAVSEIPDVIAKYLNVVKDEVTGERLNVRRNRDKLFLINTTGGENYKILNAILLTDVLSNASMKANEDKNKKQSEVLSLINRKDVLVEEYNNMRVATRDAIEDLKQANNALRESSRKFNYIKSIIEAFNGMNDIVVQEELPFVDTSRFTEIETILKLKEKLDVPVQDKVDIVDSTRLKELTNIIKLRLDLESAVPPLVPSVEATRMKELASIINLRTQLNVVVPETVKSVDLNRIKDLMDIGKTFNQLWQINQELNVLYNGDGETKGLNENKRLLDTLAAQNNFKICKNCGTVVV